MQINKNDHVICFDVDDTLVMWDYPINLDSWIVRVGGYQVTPHLYHIEAIKKAKARGHYVIVWSQGGQEWASEVVRTLQLQDYVDLVMCKPKWIFDDLPPDAWMKRFYKELK